MCSMTVVAVLLPRFALAVAAGGREALLGRPAALAPEPGREQLVGEVSPAAETRHSPLTSRLMITSGPKRGTISGSRPACGISDTP